MKFDENGNVVDDNGTILLAATPGAGSKASPDEVKTQVDALVAEQLKEVKAKLDNSYAARDEAIRKATALEETANQAKIKALEAEGKHKEVADMKLVSLNEQLRLANERIVGFTRDTAVREALATVKFRNDRSSQMAYKDIVDQLVQDRETGQWLHKTGVTIKDFVAQFSKDEDNSFLFEPKNNSGSGMGGNYNGSAPSLTGGKKITDMTSQEALALAMAGKLGGM